jgi:hypothetical protein
MRMRDFIKLSCARLKQGVITDTAGNVFPLAAAGIFVIAAMVGGGVDMSRAYMAKNRLQAACDAGVLAGRKTVTNAGLDTASTTMANNFFNANFNTVQQDVVNPVFTPTTDDDGVTIKATASATVNTTIMKIFGKTSMAVNVECSASLGISNSDVTMVLDTTGSMDTVLSGSTQTRIQALREAMKSFYTTLDTSAKGGDARIRYAFVPYASTVNVGHLLTDLDTRYIRNSWPIQSRVPLWNTIVTPTFDSWGTPVNATSEPNYSSTSYSSWVNYTTTRYGSSTACTNALPANVAFANTGSPSVESDTTINGSGQQVVTTTSTQLQTTTEYRCTGTGSNRRHQIRTGTRNAETIQTATSDPVYIDVTSYEFNKWEYRQVTVDTSVYKTYAAVTTTNGTDGTAETSAAWGGCIEERATTNATSFSYSALTGISPSAATDLDMDSAPNVSIDSTKWAPLWPELSYRRLDSSGNATNSATSDYGRKTSSRCPARAQLLTEMAQTAFNAYADSLVTGGSTYHDIGMAWGGRVSSPQGMWQSNVNLDPANGAEVSRHLIFMTDGIMEPNNTIQQAWGIEYHDRRITTDGSTNDATLHTSRFNALCEAIKDKGIRVWVISFGTSLTTSLTTCASPESSYLAANSSQLNAAFINIATQVGELRVVQ